MCCCGRDALGLILVTFEGMKGDDGNHNEARRTDSCLLSRLKQGYAGAVSGGLGSLSSNLSAISGTRASGYLSGIEMCLELLYRWRREGERVWCCGVVGVEETCTPLVGGATP